MREESTDAVMNKYLDFFLFQTFTDMAYSDAKSFDYEQHVVSIDGKDYIDGHRIKTGNEFVTPILPITRKILERNNFNMEITSNQKYIRLYGGSWARNIQRGAANYDGAYLYKDNRNLCEIAHAICVAEHWR